MSEHFQLLAGMSDADRMLFQSEFNAVRKSPTVGAVLAFFLGGLGAHRFYLGDTGLGLVYASFCWTFIPAIIAFVETFLMPGRVNAYNEAAARDIANRIKASRRPKSSPQVTGGW